MGSRLLLVFLVSLSMVLLFSCDKDSSEEYLDEPSEEPLDIDGKRRMIDNLDHIEDNGFNAISASSDGNMILASSAHSQHIFVGEWW